MGQRNTDNMVCFKEKTTRCDKTFKVLSNLLANITNKRGWKERLSWRGENNNNWTVGMKILHVHNGCVFFYEGI